jgi:hypothetical protein
MVMGRMKDWMMDMEEQADSALQSGAKSSDDVVAYVKAQMGVCDESYIRSYTEEVMGPGGDCPSPMTGPGNREPGF